MYLCALRGTRAAQHASSCWVKFMRKEFLELVEMAKPKIIYHRKRMHFLSYDGFVMYTFARGSTPLLYLSLASRDPNSDRAGHTSLKMEAIIG